MYLPALSAGVSADEFWEMSAKEISSRIKADGMRRISEYELFDRMLCRMAYNVGQLVAVGVNAPKKYPQSFGEAFPKSDGDSEGIPVEDWERSKRHMAEYARATKGRCRHGNGNG